MPSSTAKGAPYPVGTDNAADLDVIVQDLAQWVDEHPGVTPMTTAARDALTGADLWPGRMIYNTTTGKYQSYTGTTWGEDIGGIPGAGVKALFRQATAPTQMPDGTPLVPGVVWINSAESIDIPGPLLYGYRERWQLLGNASGTVSLDFSKYNAWSVTPTAAVTLAFTGLPTNPDEAASGTLVVANSTYALSYPAGTKFPSGTPPTLNGKTYLSIVVEPGGQVVVGTAWGGVA